MKLSVIVPVFRIAENYLRQALDSLCAQSFKDMEVIVINDASPDPLNQQVLEEYAARDARFRLIVFEKNRGLSAARNAGLDAARGDYFTFLDGDDYIGADYYQTLMETAEQENADLVLCGFRRVRDDGTVIKIKKQLAIVAGKEDGDGLTRLFANLSFAVWNKLYRRERFSALRFIEGMSMVEDVAFNFRAFIMARRIAGCDKVFYYYRYAQLSVTSNARNGIPSITSNIDVMPQLLADWRNADVPPQLSAEMLRYLLYRCIRYANKFRRLKDRQFADQLWEKYKQFAEKEFAFLSDRAPGYACLVHWLFAPEKSRRFLPMKIVISRFLLKISGYFIPMPR